MKGPTASAALLGAVLCAATAPTVHAGYESGTSTTGRAAAALSAHAGVLVRFKPGTSAAERAAARRAAGVRRERGLAVNGLEAVTPAPAGAEAAVAALRRDPDVLYAEPDRARKAARVPSDPLFESQWALTRIAAPAAWDTTTGSPEVVVGVADTGADLDHPDLAPNLIPGWDFVDGDAEPDDEDPVGHGTHVAGIAGARGDDGTGAAGVAWTARIMPLRVLGADGGGTVADAIEAHERAARDGVRVVNLSFSGAHASRAERDALAAASNVLFVAAAGNDGTDVDAHPAYPCAYDLPNVLCVTAADRTDGRPSFANVGARSVDLAAPGTGIAGPAAGGGWTLLDGTSMTAPHVAGAAALLLARVPAARPEDLIAALVRTADPAPAFAGATVSGGRLDVAAALTAVRATPAPTPVPAPPPVTPRPAAPAPPPAVPVPPVAAPPAAPTGPAKLKLRRAKVRRGRLDVLALITHNARGTVAVAYRARGRTVRFSAPIDDGRIGFARRLPRPLRRGSGILSVRWRGSATVRAASLRLRAAGRPARLRRDTAALRDGVLVAAGRISTRARGVLRLRLGYAAASRTFTARIHHGRWRLSAPVPPAARAGGYLTLQFTGYRRARGGPMRGEQDGVALSGD